MPKVSVTLAPEVDISAMELAKQQHDMGRFERETNIDTTKNHLTGYLQEAQISSGNFMD